MRAVIILSCVFGVALCVPVINKDLKPTAEIISPIQAESLDQKELIRRRRTFGIDVDIYNNNGFGYFDNGNDFYGGGFGGYPRGYGYGGFGGYPGYGGYGGFGGYPGGYGGFGGYPGYGYGGYPGFGYGGFF